MKKVLLVIPFLMTYPFMAQCADCESVWKNHEEVKELPFYNLCGDQLRDALKAYMSKDHVGQHYKAAARAMRKKIDFDDSPYGARSVYNAEKYADDVPMNVEHTWPQSLGASKRPMQSDVHHLYLCDTYTNSLRSNYPFCEVENVECEHDGVKLGFVDGNKTRCFEPPEFHRGNVARSMFYFSVRYHKSIDSMQESFLRKWHIDDPVTSRDVVRNDRIEEFQFNRNVFVDYPWLVDLIEDF